MKKYINPEIEIIVLENVDVITASSGSNTYDPEGILEQNSVKWY